MLFIKMRSSLSNSDKKESMTTNFNNLNNIANNTVNLNALIFSQLDGRTASKSEVPQNFIIKKKSYNEVKEFLNSHHKISKSEMFNLQVDLKKILDELEKKRRIEEEKLKMKVSKKKKLILDKFFKCNCSLTQQIRTMNSVLN
jgi:hypothetical protein